MNEELNRFFKSISFVDELFNEASLDRVVLMKINFMYILKIQMSYQ